MIGPLSRLFLLVVRDGYQLLHHHSDHSESHSGTGGRESRHKWCHASVIAEGFRLLPHLVKPLLAEPDHAVWLLPTPDFRRAAFDSHGCEIRTRPAIRKLTQHNLLERDRMFTDRLVEETKRLELPVTEIDTAMNEGELVGQVTQTFRL